MESAGGERAGTSEEGKELWMLYCDVRILFDCRLLPYILGDTLDLICRPSTVGAFRLLFQRLLDFGLVVFPLAV